MIMDKENQFSAAQAITAAANSTNVIDSSAAGEDLGAGENLFIVAVVTTAFTDAGSDSTLNVSLQTDDNSAMASPTVIQDLFTFPALSPVGTKKIARIQPATFERYVGLVYTPANGNLTAGAVSAMIVKDADIQKFYPDAINIA